MDKQLQFEWIGCKLRLRCCVLNNCLLKDFPTQKSSQSLLIWRSAGKAGFQALPSLFCEWLEWWNSPYINHFISADTIVPGYANPQNLNRFSYVRNNPLRYTDPTGHVVANDNDGGVSSKGCLPSELACQVEKSERYKRHKEKQRQDELFQLIFSGSASDGSWTYTDQYRYYTNRSSFWGQPESWDRNGAKGWELFASQASQLAAAYSPAARDEFVRDFGLAFAGIPSQSSFVSAAFGVKNGPGQLTFLNYSNDGLLSKYLDKNSEGNQSHHYAGLFVLGYFAGSNSATVVNVMRDLDNPGDIALGNVAAEHGGSFAMTGAMSQINQLISSTGP